MNSENFDVFIPVRTASVRLPKKHLLEINGQPSLKILTERLKKAKKIRKIIVCTTNSKSDDHLIEFLKDENIEFFRGDEKDILQRFLDAAKFFKTDVIIDVEGDKIYTDPYFVDKIVDEMQKSNIDFIIGNDSNKTFNPANHLVHGFIPAGFRTTALERICGLKNTKNNETGYKEFFLLPKLFKTKFLVFKANQNLSKKVRLTIDYESDYILAKKIFKKLGTDFNYEDVLDLFLKNPRLIEITHKSIRQWEKNYRKSITDFSLKNKPS